MPGGRPSRIDQVIANETVTAPDGSTHTVEVTVAQRVLRYVRAGAHVSEAAAAVGVSRETLYAWLRRGSDVNMELALTDGRPTRDLTRHDQLCADFAVEHASAIADWEMRELLLLQRLSQGGIPQVTTTRKEVLDKEGEVHTLVTTTESTTLPDARAITWLLEKRLPERYGQRIEIDHGLALPGAARADELVDMLDRWQSVPDAEPPAIEASSSDAGS